MKSLLAELKTVIGGLGLFVVTGAHGADIYEIPEKNEYVTLIPLGYNLTMYADNIPQSETQEVRISLFCRDDFMPIMRRLTLALLKADIIITDRQYVGWERETRYHYYAIDVSKDYYFEMEDEQ